MSVTHIRSHHLTSRYWLLIQGLQVTVHQIFTTLGTLQQQDKLGQYLVGGWATPLKNISQLG